MNTPTARSTYRLPAPKQALFPAAPSAMHSPAASVRSLRSPELDDARRAFIRPTPLASTSRSPRSKIALVLGLAASLVWVLLAACGDAATSDGGETDLGTLNSKQDGITLRTASVSVAAGEIKRFRVEAEAFVASLLQTGAVEARLSAIHRELETIGDASTEPTLSVAGDGTLRLWTIRVENLGDEVLEADFEVLDWDPKAPAAPYVGTLGAELRRMDIDVAPGDTKTFRVKAVRFFAELVQTGDVLAALSAKHYDNEVDGEPSLSPTLNAIADIDELRNWTLRVHNQGDEQLTGQLIVSELLADEPEIGIVSDIDKTLLPPQGSSADLPPPYPGMVPLLNALEFGPAGASQLPGDLRFVTARTEARLEGVPEWMASWGVPEGPISTGISGIPWVARAEKVRDISAIFDAAPAQRFVMFGDSSHRDPEAYRDIIELYPGRVIGAFIHVVTNSPDSRFTGLTAIRNYAEAFASLAGLGVISVDEAWRLFAEAQAQGLDLTDADFELLIEQRSTATP